MEELLLDRILKLRLLQFSSGPKETPATAVRSQSHYHHHHFYILSAIFMHSCHDIIQTGVSSGELRPGSVFPGCAPRLRTHATCGFVVSEITHHCMTSNTSFGRLLAYFCLVALMQRLEAILTAKLLNSMLGD